MNYVFVYNTASKDTIFFWIMQEGWKRVAMCRVNKQVQNYKKCLKNSTLGEEKFNFSLGLLLILA